MDEMLADGLEIMADLDKGLQIIIRARGDVTSATRASERIVYVQFICAGFSGLVTKGSL